MSAFNVCTGAAPEEPFFNTNNDDEVTEADKLPSGDIPNVITLDDFITYSPTMIEDKIYFGPQENYTVQDYPTGVLFWRYLNYN